MEFGYETSEDGLGAMCGAVQAVLRQQPHALRQMGSGVLDLCYVAAGRMDAVYAGVAGVSLVCVWVWGVGDIVWVVIYYDVM